MGSPFTRFVNTPVPGLQPPVDDKENSVVARHGRLIDLYGFGFDPSTGKLYDPDDNETAYTFEFVPGYNPLHYASEETAQQVADIVIELCGNGVGMQIVRDTNRIVPQGRVVRVSYGNSICELNAGLIASAIVRYSNLQSAIRPVMAELARAGIPVR